MVDLGVAFGLTGVAIALISLTYARTQATAARRQADAEWRLARVEIGNAFSDRVRHARTRIVQTPAIAREYTATNPALAKVAESMGGLEAVVVLRDFLDATQEMFFLRKEGLISDFEWRGWVTSAIPIARMPSLRAIFENAVAREALEPEFVDFFRPLAGGGVGRDPLGRVTLDPRQVTLRGAPDTRS